MNQITEEYISVDGNVSAKFKSIVRPSNDKIYILIEEFYKDLRYNKGRYEEFRQVINAAAIFYESSIILERI